MSSVGGRHVQSLYEKTVLTTVAKGIRIGPVATHTGANMKLYLDAKEVKAALLLYAEKIAPNPIFNEVEFDCDYRSLKGATISYSEVVAQHGAEDE